MQATLSVVPGPTDLFGDIRILALVILFNSDIWEPPLPIKGPHDAEGIRIFIAVDVLPTNQKKIKLNRKIDTLSSNLEPNASVS